MTSIPDELLAINVRLKKLLIGLTKEAEIKIDYKINISQFRIAASIIQYKETSKIILKETKGLINEVLQSKHQIFKTVSMRISYEKRNDGYYTEVVGEDGPEEIFVDKYIDKVPYTPTSEDKMEWFNLIKKEVKAYAQLLIENGIPFEYLPEEVQKNEKIIELIVNAEVGSNSIFTPYSKELLRKLLLEDNLLGYIFSDNDSIQIHVEKGVAAYFFKELIKSEVCLNFKTLLDHKKKIYYSKTELTTDKLRDALSRFKNNKASTASIKEIDTIISQMKAL
jgi:hypothetical protein